MASSLPESFEKSAAKMIRGFGALAILGAVAFLASLAVDPMRGWQAYLINFLFWTGIAQGAVVFAAIYHVAGAKWSPPLRRLGEGAAAFLPVSWLLFLPLYFGLKKFFGEVLASNPERGAWFDPRFIFVRGGLGVGLMTVLSLFFVYYSLRPQIGMERERSRLWLHRWMADGWKGERAERLRSERGMDFLAAGVLLAYPIIYSFMAFDLIMALDPFWYSSLFGGYFFVSTFYLGLAGLAVAAAFVRRSAGDAVVTSSQLSDLGKLMLGFDLTYLAMVWAQYIVIWYGNLPEETHFIILRVWERPWAAVSWSVFALAAIVPFLFFLSRRAKESATVLLVTGVSIAAGLWLERFVLIAPSLSSGKMVALEFAPRAVLGWIEAGVALGFLGSVGLSYVFFLKNFPLIPLERASVAVESDMEETA